MQMRFLFNQLNEDKASGGCHEFLIVRAQLKIRTQLRQGEIDSRRYRNKKVGISFSLSEEGG